MVAMGTPGLRLLTPEEWRTFRDLRLRALTDAPHAFGSTLAREQALTGAEWRQRLARRAQFVVVIDGSPAATAAGIRSQDGASAELVSMWVEPAWRGRGLGALLVSEVLAWGTAQGLAEVRLWVTEGNRQAERLYLRHGFTPTGERQPVLPEEPTRFEFGMVRTLHGRPDS
jgi:GNAT superfamily N-acetyltransferase